MLPEILLFGEAGSGKDTVAAMIVEKYNGVSVAMADPMKRLAMRAFGFTEDQLWGPSANRNALDPRYTVTRVNEHAGAHEEYAFAPAWKDARQWVEFLSMDWLKDVLGLSRIGRDVGEAHTKLRVWLQKLEQIAAEQGGLSPRAMLQTLGTEWGRFVDRRIWIQYAQRIQRSLLGGGYTYDRTKGLVETPGQTYSFALVTDGRFRNEALEFKAGGATVIRVVNPMGGGLTAGVKGHASEQEQKTIPDSWFDAVLVNNKDDGLSVLRWTVEDLMSEITQPRVYRT
jgi:hypothetical protein